MLLYTRLTVFPRQICAISANNLASTRKPPCHRISRSRSFLLVAMATSSRASGWRL